MGVVDRLILRDDQWQRLSPHIIGDERTRGSSGRNNQLFVEAALWIMRTGSPWRAVENRRPSCRRRLLSDHFIWTASTQGHEQPLLTGFVGDFTVRLVI